MVSITSLAELGALFGNPARASMLAALMKDRELTATELAHRAGIAPQTASGHIARLTTVGLLRIEKRGRHRYHRLASADLRLMLERLTGIVAAISDNQRKGMR
jgi:DNA-binding transcriptional ArsR family regulator